MCLITGVKVDLYGDKGKRTGSQVIAGDEWTECPLSWMQRECPAFFSLWREFVMCKLFHCLPYAGGWNEQPDRVQRTFALFSDVEGGMQRRINETHKR